MSKKLYSTSKWKRYLKSRQLYQLRRTRERRRRRRGAVPLTRRQARNLPFVTLALPKNFSIIHNAADSIKFLREFKYLAKDNNLTLNLTAVTHITVDAITALIAEILSLSGKRIVNGNNPNNEACKDLLIRSGFFDHVKSRRPLPSGQKGKIAPRKSHRVEGATAKELIRIGTEAAFGTSRKSYPAYSALIECMSNTHNHATGRREQYGAEMWYSTVYGDANTQSISYTFLDTGVGIFRSVRLNKLKKLYNKLFRGEDHRDILRDILLGRIASRTGLPFRGKGLPGIYKSFRAGRIKSLIIVSNDVYADVANDDYRLLRIEFPGTTVCGGCTSTSKSSHLRY
jgi:hypothetical protein